MKKIFLILFVSVFCSPVFGQQESTENKAISRGKIFTTDSQVIEGQYIVISKDSIEYYVKNSQVRNALNLNQATKVLEYRGNYGSTGGWIGFGVGLGVGIAVAVGSAETKTSAYVEETTIQTWPIYVFPLVGGLVGYLIGKGVDDWGTVYSSKNKSTTAFLKNIDIKQNSFRGVAVSYNVHF
ncbi:MAG: hypothetical protein HGB26_05745 [Desulfobulbaceae bacterium]|jgi:hypothetical protein|nr:hypothetical protein [Desulfobulbaceae bacterium]